MMKKLLVTFLLLSITLLAPAQDIPVANYGATINQNELRALLTIIASDALEGRETGTRGQKMAAAFIAEEFKQLGLLPIVPGSGGTTYLQKFTLENYNDSSIYLQTSNQLTYTLRHNILFAGKYAMEKPVQKELLLLKGRDMPAGVKDKVAVIIAPDAGREDYPALAKAAYGKGAAMVVIAPFATGEAFVKYRRSQGRNYARRHNAFAQKTVAGIPHGYFLVSPIVLKDILGTDQETTNTLLRANTPPHLIRNINARNNRLTWFTSLPAAQLDTENVLGYLEGTDKKEEVVIITAHYDHIGIRDGQINNGADDDGSGTVSVLEIAEAFVQAQAAGHGPRRSILFMTVTGEEKGLIGSQYYTNNPVLPLANTVVDLNIDMIGRHDKAHENNLDFVYLVGADRLSSELHALSEMANSTFTHLTLDYTYNDENHPERIYYRSDHWNFAKNNIPIIFYFSGVHEDYHRPTDTVDKIEFNLLQKRAQLVFYTAWQIANREERLRVDKLQGPGRSK